MNNEYSMIDSIDLARHLLALSQEQDDFIDSNTKLNKLLYIIYGLYLAITEDSIINEKPKCFPYGPIFTKVFKAYKKLKPLKTIIDDKILQDAIETTIYNFKDWSASALSGWSHQAGSPWDKTYNNDKENYGLPLDNNDIRLYFKNNVLDE